MIDTFLGTLRVRKWPKKRGPPKSAAQKFWVDWFTQANRLAKYASAMDIEAAMEGTAKSGLYPRDVLLKAMRGRLYWWVDENGWRWYPVAAIGDISETLDVLAQSIGSVLVRATDRWRAPPAGAIGDALLYQGPDDPPIWGVPGGAGVPFGGALVDSLGNQSIPNNTFTNLIFDNEVYDTDALHDNVTNPSRLTVPPGWTKVRLSAGVRWASNNSGNRIVFFRKNGATFAGMAEHNRRAAANSEDSIAALAVPGVEGDYFEARVWQNRGAALNILGATPNTYFQMERAA